MQDSLRGIHIPAFLTHFSLAFGGPLEGMVGAGVGVGSTGGRRLCHNSLCWSS